MCSEGSGFGLSPVDHEPPGAATGKVVIREGKGLLERWGREVNQGR